MRRKQPCSSCRARKIRCDQLPVFGACKNCLFACLECSGPVKTAHRLRKEAERRAKDDNINLAPLPPCSAPDAQLHIPSPRFSPSTPSWLNNQELLPLPPFMNGLVDHAPIERSFVSHALGPVSPLTDPFPIRPACCPRCRTPCISCFFPGN